MQPVEVIENSNQINAAFSKQSLHYDTDDLQNPLLQAMRLQVYNHVSIFISKPCRMLELNAGTGIDALYFVQQVHIVHATDLSHGMIERINQNVVHHPFKHMLSFQKLTYY